MHEEAKKGQQGVFGGWNGGQAVTAANRLQTYKMNYTLHDINLLVLAPVHNAAAKQCNGGCWQLLGGNLVGHLHSTCHNTISNGCNVLM